MPTSHAKPSSLFIGSFSLDPSTRPKSPAPRSPRSFDNGAVGLGIVAAMFGSGLGGAPGRSAPAPIPIVSSRPAACWVKPISMEEQEEEEAMELSERYTYVISHVGGKPVNKRTYFDGGSGGGDGGCGGDPRVLVEPLRPVAWPLPPPVLNFLSRCYLCRKDLHGLDIFMYSGDKAFCSVDCRSQQILSDERMEKCGSEAMMKPHFDCSLSPCPAPLFLAAGVAAA